MLNVELTQFYKLPPDNQTFENAYGPVRKPNVHPTYIVVWYYKRLKCDARKSTRSLTVASSVMVYGQALSNSFYPFDC